MNTNSTQMLCVLQLKYLTADPFDLLIGEPIIVRVQAINRIGSGQFSEPITTVNMTTIKKELTNFFPDIKPA